ncbi:MAG: hypothetical protein C4547_06510 [Phycisphaerales bacterium]|nr:MAG: hypothetical protein C4547_06510 [Phycisphaerales bacterium]
MVLFAWTIGVSPADAQSPSYGQAAPRPLQPDQIAPILPDGSLGPWRDFVASDAQTGGEPLAAVWDSYELDPRDYNRRSNLPREYYDVPPGSGKFCLEDPGSRLFWCDPEKQGCQRLPSCVSTTGGLIARDAPDRVFVTSFAWGVVGAPERLQIEFQYFDTYDATDCDDPGSNMIGGFVGNFLDPPPGDYITTVDMFLNGTDFDTPDTGRIGIKMTMWVDRRNGVHSERAFPLLWITKSDWADKMGQADENGFSDGHGDKNCEVGDNPDECVRGEPVCPNGDAPVGPAVLLLGEGEFGNCQYALKSDAKAKKGCATCPKKGDVYDTADECVDKFDCRVKLKVKRIDCPGGGDGFCKAIKGKRLDCRR